jgi:diamine N-acetyltransferase
MHLDDLYVKLDCRGNGIGTVLINKVIDFAKESGCHEVVWTVSQWNKPAIEFYKNLGAQTSEPELICGLQLD